MSFRRRSYPEVLDSLLTTIIGGVAAESIRSRRPTRRPPFRATLQQPPAVDARLRLRHARRPAAPLPQERRLHALGRRQQRSSGRPKGAEYPDAGTLVEVSYRPAGARGGRQRPPRRQRRCARSRSRSRSRSPALRPARGRLRLRVRRHGDRQRRSTTSSRCSASSACAAAARAGEIEFTRARRQPGEITIPAGTRVVTADGSVEYETTETVTMREAQTTIRVVARDLEPNDPLLGGRADGAAGADRRHRRRHEPRADGDRRRGRDRRRAAHAREELPARQRAGDARCAQAGDRGARITADVDETSTARCRADHAARRRRSRPSSSSACCTRSRTHARPASR